jgi:hypothetical protein
MGKTLIVAKLWNHEAVAFVFSCVSLERSDLPFIGTQLEGWEMKQRDRR